jgi:hypothetical protein
MCGQPSTTPRRVLLLPDGRALSERALSKVRGDEQGHTYVERELVRFGARPRQRGEPGAAWLRGRCRRPPSGPSCTAGTICTCSGWACVVDSLRGREVVRVDEHDPDDLDADVAPKAVAAVMRFLRGREEIGDGVLAAEMDGHGVYGLQPDHAGVARLGQDNLTKSR